MPPSGAPLPIRHWLLQFVGPPRAFSPRLWASLPSARSSQQWAGSVGCAAPRGGCCTPCPVTLAGNQSGREHCDDGQPPSASDARSQTVKLQDAKVVHHRAE
eukprot:4302622-Amphidinium_carterae.1